MAWPLVILAAVTVLLGYFGTNPLKDFLEAGTMAAAPV